MHVKTLTPEKQVSESGLRFYSPSLGRWLSRDGIGEEEGNSLYCYVVNRPVDFVDPLGHKPWYCLWAGPKTVTGVVYTYVFVPPSPANPWSSGFQCLIRKKRTWTRPYKCWEAVGWYNWHRVLGCEGIRGRFRKFDWVHYVDTDRDVSCLSLPTN